MRGFVWTGLAGHCRDFPRSISQGLTAPKGKHGERLRGLDEAHTAIKPSGPNGSQAELDGWSILLAGGGEGYPNF